MADARLFLVFFFFLIPRELLFSVHPPDNICGQATFKKDQESAFVALITHEVYFQGS